MRASTWPTLLRCKHSQPTTQTRTKPWCDESRGSIAACSRRVDSGGSHDIYHARDSRVVGASTAPQRIRTASPRGGRAAQKVRSVGDRDVGILYGFFAGGIQVQLIFMGILETFYTRNQVQTRRIFAGNTR